MPDWSYQTVFRPVFMRMKPAVARDIALAFMGGLSRMPLGTHIVSLLRL